jgi:alanyl-tRNA synthetase
LVFNQYYKNSDGSFVPLKKVGVDTGAGLERQLMVATFGEEFLNKTVYDTDIFLDQMELLKAKSESYDLKSARIVSDHFRASIFLITNGVIPSNVERGYVLRRLIRRILRHLRRLGIQENIFNELLNNLQNNFGEFYKEMMDTELILKVLNQEKIKFELTLENGLKELNRLFQKNDKTISGKEAFYIYETFGFPIELIKEEASNSLFLVDENEFENEFNIHKEISKAGMEKKFGGHDLKNVEVDSESFKIRTKLHTATHLLLKALRTVLGDDVFQKGSDINDERLRFDFTFSRKLTEEELKKVEDLVNEKISEKLKVNFKEEKLEEALKEGYLGSFMAKYPEVVKVYDIGGWSKEICAGPHVENISELRGIKILKEEASSQGVRRIKAVLK